MLDLESSSANLQLEISEVSLTIFSSWQLTENNNWFFSVR